MMVLHFRVFMDVHQLKLSPSTSFDASLARSLAEAKLFTLKRRWRCDDLCSGEIIYDLARISSTSREENRLSRTSLLHQLSWFSWWNKKKEEKSLQLKILYSHIMSSWSEMCLKGFSCAHTEKWHKIFQTNTVKSAHENSSKATSNKMIHLIVECMLQN